MGTDIHFYVEVKQPDGTYETADHWELSKDWPDHGLDVPYTKSFYHDRCYSLFAILADVRNGFGFAGVATGEGFVPIAAQRGLPHDMNSMLARYAATNCDHSASWLTLRELLDYDWTQVTTKYGVVNAKEYQDWGRYDRDRGEGPKVFCGGVSGRDVRNITEEEMAAAVKVIIDTTPDNLADPKWKRINQRLETELANTYCRVSWKESYHQACRDFWWQTIPRLLRLGKPEDVRCVFWFDS